MKTRLSRASEHLVPIRGECHTADLVAVALIATLSCYVATL